MRSCQVFKLSWVTAILLLWVTSLECRLKMVWSATRTQATWNLNFRVRIFSYNLIREKGTTFYIVHFPGECISSRNLSFPKSSRTSSVMQIAPLSGATKIKPSGERILPADFSFKMPFWTREGRGKKNGKRSTGVRATNHFPRATRKHTPIIFVFLLFFFCFSLIKFDLVRDDTGKLSPYFFSFCMTEINLIKHIIGRVVPSVWTIWLDKF